METNGRWQDSQLARFLAFFFRKEKDVAWQDAYVFAFSVTNVVCEMNELVFVLSIRFGFF